MPTPAFGDNRKVQREIFYSSHQHMIAIRTPRSGIFTAAAEASAAHVGLPLQWLDAGLKHLESVRAEAIAGNEHPLDA